MYVYFIVICLLMKESLPLKILQVTVPTYRVIGEQAQLKCDYELGDDTLYSVKWYRDNEEFYRYHPTNNPPNLAFKLEGIDVDLLKSDGKKVFLNQLTLKSTGLYRCEVSAEAPTFASASAEGRMEVLSLPREGPRITGNKPDIQQGDYIFFNCTSGQSYPAVALSWDIDGEKVTDPNLLIEYPPVQFDGLVSTTLGLRVPSGRTMQVRCTAKVTPASREGNEAVIKSRINDREAMFLVRSSAEASTFSATVLILSFALLLEAPMKLQM